MSITDIAISVGTGLGSSAVLVALINTVSGRGGRRAEAAAKLAETQNLQHERWFKEANEAYERMGKECSRCNDRLDEVNARLWQLIDGLDDMCALASNGMVKVAELRAVLRAARQQHIKAAAP